MTTMQDIADRAGVTRATVSNVLNGKYVSSRKNAARRASRIRKIAEEMGYRPSTWARATRTGRTGCIGMIQNPSVGSSVQQPLFSMALDAALHRRGLCLVRELLDNDAGTAPRIVREKIVDGLIINYAFDAPPPVHELLERCRIPAIWVNCKHDQNCVRPADMGAAMEATEYLIRHGHADIAYMSIRSKRDAEAIHSLHYSKRDRLAGYLRAMRNAGLRPRVEHLQMPEDSAEVLSGWQTKASVEYLSRPNRPSAVLCNLSGRTILYAAEIANLRVPRDLSVIAFDNNADTDRRVALDHVLVPYWQLGEAVVSELCQLIEHPDTPRDPVVIPFAFYGANTVARPEA